MADDTEGTETGPSLEPPRLFGRRRRKQAPTAESAPAPEPAPVAEPAPVRETAPAGRFEDSGTTVTEPVREPVPDTEAEAADADDTPTPRSRRRRSFTLRLPTRVAGILVGLVVGYLLLLLVQLGQAACHAVSGTSACGPAPGMLGMVVIFVLGVVAGGYLLRLTGVPDPGSTSFIAVGMTALVALLFLGGQLEEWWMVLAIPGLSAFWFLLSAWVTTTFVDADDI